MIGVAGVCWRIKIKCDRASTWCHYRIVINVRTRRELAHDLGARAQNICWTYAAIIFGLAGANTAASSNGQSILATVMVIGWSINDGVICTGWSDASTKACILARALAGKYIAATVEQSYPEIIGVAGVGWRIKIKCDRASTGYHYRIVIKIRTRRELAHDLGTRAQNIRRCKAAIIFGLAGANTAASRNG